MFSHSIVHDFFLPARRGSQAELSGFFYHKIQFYRQFADLGMQFSSFLFEILATSPASLLLLIKYPRKSLCKNTLPI